MPRKKSSVSKSNMKLEDVNQQEILKIIFDKVDLEPPVGERYEFLLRKIIEASIDENGINLSNTDRIALIDEIFAYVASYGPIAEYFTVLKLARLW